MKRIISALVSLCLMLACLTAACAEEVDLDALINANTYEALSAQYAAIGMNETIYGADGEIREQHLAVCDNAGHMMVDDTQSDFCEYLEDQETIYSYEPDSEIPSSVYFIITDEEYENYKTWYIQRFIRYEETETLISAEMDGDKLIVTTESSANDDSTAYYAQEGFQGVTGFQCVYTADPETNLIHRCESSLITENGIVKYSVQDLYTSDETIAEPDFVTEMKKADTRTLTIHMEGTDLTFSGRKGYPIQFTVPEGCGAFNSADGEIFDQASDYDADVEIFLLAENDQAE